jgi:uncharacterized protein YdeI (YjbR/CyaY-like superfamily)
MQKPLSSGNQSDERTEAVFFETQEAFREWLWANHETQAELLVGFYKVGSGKKSMTWSESVDQALCFGWIDGVRKSRDEHSYTIRFTPRKPNSIWSAVNIRKVAELTDKRLMQPAGLKAYEKRTESKSTIYAYEQTDVALSKAFEEKLKDSTQAWAFFQKQAPSYRKTIIHWIMSAKQEATRLSRLEKLIESCVNGKRL